MSEEWKEVIIVPIYKKGDRTYCTNYRGISLLSTTYKIATNFLLSKLTPYAEEITGGHQCGFQQLLIIYPVYIKYLRKNGNTMKQCISYLYISTKSITQLGRGVLYYILTELGIP